ncbi:protease inhibitor I9 family protein [Longimicrobium sp.]|uniref:protease inhibitor I9 family protein n=1 Tax=Longimicrobium sp. TaxID=2029185 RepID=UPI002E3353D5|nr:protease inhibitor I9 family protein [Longimicrobium sp.]HEX6037711.1 protease inhibitor I9 family protein [Longimicrobium sp.]
MSTDRAPLHGRASAAAPSYIVVFRDGTHPDDVTDALAAEHGFTPKYVFRNALLGFAAELSAGALDAIRRHPAVKYVEHDAPVQAS